MSNRNQKIAATYQIVETDANLNVTQVTVPNLAVSGTSELGNVGNVKITGGIGGQVLSTDGLGNLNWTTGGGGSNQYQVARTLYVRRSGTNQTIPSGNWSNRDVIFNTISQQTNIPYDTTTGLANLVGNVTYRITSALAWQAATSYLYTYAVVDSANTVLSPVFENVPAASSAVNTMSPQIDFIYRPNSDTQIKIRTQSGSNAATGESIRGDLNTFMSIEAIDAPYVSTGATGIDYVQVKNSTNFSVTANATIVFNTVVSKIGIIDYNTTTGNFTLKANTTYRLATSGSSDASFQWWPVAWEYAANGAYLNSQLRGISSTDNPGASHLEMIYTTGTSDEIIRLAVDGNHSGTLSANGGWAIVQAIGGQATTTNLTLLGNVHADGVVKTTSKTVGNLVLATTVGAGSRSFVTDANTITFNAIVGSGGTNAVPVFSDGTNWRVG